MKHQICFLFIPLVIIVILSGCKEISNPTGTTIKSNISILQGDIEGWNLVGNYQLKLLALSNPYANSFDVVLDSCLISQFGTFILLPKPVPDSITTPYWPDHPKTISVSDTTVKLSQELRLAVYSNSSKSYVGYLFKEKDSLGSIYSIGWFYTYYIYVTGDLNINGYYVPYTNAGTNYYNYEFKKGWNAICVITRSVKENNGSTEYTSHKPDGGKWVYINGTK